MSNRKEKLAIFDLDGTLFDTRTINYFAYKQALNEEGFLLDKEFYEANCNGKYYKDYLPLLVPSPSFDLMERIHRRKKQLYPENLKYAIVNTRLFELIEQIRNNYFIALVTTASKENCMDILGHFNKTSLFELILTHNDVEKVKPEPEGFIKAMKHFSIEPQNTIIFEDSPSGVEAAKRSGGAGVLVVTDFAEN